MPAIPRRRFLKTTVAATSAVFAAPAILRANTTSAETVIGEGEHTYKIIHNWPQLPDKYTWQTTHNVAVDKANNLYVIHEGKENQKEHPSIFFFDSTGKFIRSFAKCICRATVANCE